MRETTRGTREASKKLSLLATVSHEFRTPLTNLRLYAEMMAGASRMDEAERKKYLAIISDEAERLALRNIRGKVAIANAKLAYVTYEEVFSGPEWDELAAAGAAIDRVHARMGEFLRVGRTEAEVGADIAAAILAESDEREVERERGPMSAGERRTSEDTVA